MEQSVASVWVKIPFDPTSHYYNNNIILKGIVNNMIKVGIIGSTGYAGQELVRILLQHPDAEIVWYGSRSYIDKKYSDVFGNMFQLVDDVCLGENMDWFCLVATLWFIWLIFIIVSLIAMIIVYHISLM